MHHYTYKCNWDTTNYADGDYTIIARGYASGDFQDHSNYKFSQKEKISCFYSNSCKLEYKHFVRDLYDDPHESYLHQELYYHTTNLHVRSW